MTIDTGNATTIIDDNIYDVNDFATIAQICEFFSWSFCNED
jgi:hypothetical protein